MRRRAQPPLGWKLAGGPVEGAPPPVGAAAAPEPSLWTMVGAGLLDVGGDAGGGVEDPPVIGGWAVPDPEGVPDEGWLEPAEVPPEEPEAVPALVGVVAGTDAPPTVPPPLLAGVAPVFDPPVAVAVTGTVLRRRWRRLRRT